jgi:uncharacterized membrane protein YqhA
MARFMNRFEGVIEYIIEYMVFASRWVQAPVYLGLIFGGLLYVYACSMSTSSWKS